MPCAVTRLSTTGETLGTVTGTRTVLPGGWVERFKDPEATATTLAQEPSASGLATELVNVETGTIIDATGFRVSAETLPHRTGNPLVHKRHGQQRLGGRHRRPHDVFLVSRHPGSTTLRTDDMPWITDHVIADDKQTLSRSVIHMEKS